MASNVEDKCTECNNYKPFKCGERDGHPNIVWCCDKESCEFTPRVGPPKDPPSICDHCIHDSICGCEGHLDPAMLFCAYMIDKNVAGYLARTSGIRLSDITPLLKDTSWFTVTKRTGETNSKDAFDNPVKYLVLGITFDSLEEKIVIIIEEESCCDRP